MRGMAFLLLLVLAGIGAWWLLRPGTGSTAGRVTAVERPVRAGDPLLSSSTAEKSPPALTTPPATPVDSTGIDPATGRIRRIHQKSIADFARRYDALVRAANAGDIAATYELYEGNHVCRDAPADQADLDGQIREDERNYPPEQARSFVEFKKKRYAECSHLSMAQKTSWKEWLKRAAALGDARARIIFVRTGGEIHAKGADKWKELDEYRELATRYLDEGVALGNLDALAAASAAYGTTLSPHRLFPPDGVKSYAYAYAYLLASPEQSQTYVDSLARQKQSMSETEIRQAEALGAEIYARCCKH